jgi:glutathione S-transferase
VLTLYYSKASSALASHILLEEVGAHYALHEVPLAKGAHREPSYLAINPKGRVPALRTPEGIITENPAILNYVAATHPQAGMLPETLFERAQADALNAYICATVHVAFAHKQRGARWADSEDAQKSMQDKVASNLADCASVIEQHYLVGPWALGDRFTHCDAYLVLVPRWLRQAGVDLNPYPKLKAHHEAMMHRPATLAVMAVHGI